MGKKLKYYHQVDECIFNKKQVTGFNENVVTAANINLV